MARFKARIIGRKGVIEVNIDAKNKEDANLIAQKQGVGKVDSISKVGNIFSDRGMRAEDRQVFLMRFSSMLGSKMGASDSLSMMSANFPGRIGLVSSRLLGLIENGYDISNAIEAVGTKDFPMNVQALIKAGAASGDTVGALKQAADFERRMAEIKKGSGKGLIMAVVFFVISLAMILGTTYFVAPAVMESSFVKNGGAMDDVIEIVGYANITSVIMIIIGTVFGALFALSTVGKQVMPVFSDAVIMKIPFYKELVLSRNAYVTLFGMARLVSSGVRMEEVIRLTCESTPKGQLKEDMKASMVAVSNGKHWVDPIKSFDDMDKAALRSAQDREDIVHNLSALSEYHKDMYAHRIAALTPILQLFAAVFMSIAGAFIFFLTIFPMLKATSGLLG